MIDTVDVQIRRTGSLIGNKGKMGIDAGVVSNAEVKVHYTKESRTVCPGIFPLLILYRRRRVAMAYPSDQSHADLLLVRIAIDDELVGDITAESANIVDTGRNIGGEKAW